MAVIVETSGFLHVDEARQLRQDVLEISGNVLVATPEDAQTHGLQLALPQGILLLGPLMYRSVDLDHQAALGAKKVDHIGTDRMLAPELEPEEPAASQFVP